MNNYYYPGPGIEEFMLLENRIVLDLNATDYAGVS